MNEYKKIVRDKLLALRSIEYHMEQPAFEEAFAIADQFQKTALNQILIRADLAALKEWVRATTDHILENKTWRELRLLARANQITGYGQMSKHELLKELRQCNGKKS